MIEAPRCLSVAGSYSVVFSEPGPIGVNISQAKHGELPVVIECRVGLTKPYINDLLLSVDGVVLSGSADASVNPSFFFVFTMHWIHKTYIY
jgi:hypothetical protein